MDLIAADGLDPPGALLIFGLAFGGPVPSLPALP